MRLSLILISFLVVGTAAAQSNNASNGPKRVALVVGNDGYKQVSTLMNAKADATAIARSLEKAGFKVTLKTDVNLDSFKVALRSFKAMVSPGDEAVFFFSGHGVEMGGANYLLPIDIKGDAEDQVRDDAVPLQRVLEDLQERKARFSLAIIDACRNNPFRDSGRAIGGRGLAPTTAATGQMVLYSAGSGQQALDRLSDRDPVRNGVFTRVLLKEMETPGLPVGDVLRNVREEVASLAKSVGKDQVPAIYDQSLGRFYFTQPRAGAVLAQAQGGQTEGAVPAALNKVDPAALDLAFWDSIKSSQDRSDFEEYLRQFPEGRFSGLARNRMRQLSAAASSAPASVPASVPAAAPAAASAAAPAAAVSGESIYQQGNKYWNGTGVAKNEVEAVRLYRQAADLGHAASQSMVGFAYDLGRGGIAKNDAEALRWYRLSANQGYAHGQYLLGTMYQNGQAVAKDLAEARRWFQLSANQGNENGKKALERLETASAAPAPAAPSVESLFKQANDLWNGNGVAKNETEAVRLYRQAADQGHAPSQASLGYAFDLGKGVTKNDAEALKWYRQSAAAGNARGQWLLGTMYEQAQAVTRDYAEAVKWYRLSANQGYASGQADLADMYEYGKGIAKDMNEALRLYRLAADQGNDSAKKALDRLKTVVPAMSAEKAYEEALRLWNGTGVAKNEAEAVRLFRIAADQGHGDAQASLGYAYDMGTGVAKSDAEALKWYRMSAATGNARGQVLLGTMFEGAQGVTRDYSEALKWYRLAANQGNAYGQNNLGGMYEFGRGVTKDMNEALRLYRLAADQGNDNAKKSLERLKTAAPVMSADKAYEEAQRYWNGTGVAKNEAEAVRFYRIAADQGHAEAQASLGYAYDMGKGIAKSDPEALKWYRLSAASGNARGQWLLGTMYELAQGVSKDVAEALKWYRLSANQGNGKGQSALARMYRDGTGVAQSDAEALRLFRLSVASGNADANGDLAWCYENGRGVTKNMSEAIRLHQLAARQGLQYSRDALTRLGQTW
jgi:TPR repeat protein